jgi:hypothetical protein
MEEDRKYLAIGSSFAMRASAAGNAIKVEALDTFFLHNHY